METCTPVGPALHSGTYNAPPVLVAAIGALRDQGVQITIEDRSAGIVRGTRNGINVTANLRTQADGSVRVEFNTSGATERDPALIDRISQSYNRRMGR